MKFTERREFTYDSEVFKKMDVQTALKIHAEFVRKGSPIPQPKFFEVSRQPGEIDPLWHTPTGPRTTFTRELAVPAIVQFDKLDWRVTLMGRQPRQTARAWLANLILQELDYFPVPGDLVFWGGYRFGIISLEFEPNSYWGQTNVWLGIIAKMAIVADGDASPAVDPSKALPAEVSASKARPKVAREA